MSVQIDVNSSPSLCYPRNTTVLPRIHAGSRALPCHFYRLSMSMTVITARSDLGAFVGGERLYLCPLSTHTVVLVVMWRLSLLPVSRLDRRCSRASCRYSPFAAVSGYFSRTVPTTAVGSASSSILHYSCRCFIVPSYPRAV